MKTIIDQEYLDKESMIKDPLCERKQGLKNQSSDINNCRTKLSDPYYIEHAIEKIASELLHFLVK